MWEEWREGWIWSNILYGILKEVINIEKIKLKCAVNVIRIYHINVWGYIKHITQKKINVLKRNENLFSDILADPIQVLFMWPAHCFIELWGL